MKFPKLTHQQAKVLEYLYRHEEVFAYYVQKHVEIRGPAFYQLMGRLKKVGYVKSHFEVDKENKRRETVYKITSAGQRAYNEVLDFYRELLSPL